MPPKKKEGEGKTSEVKARASTVLKGRVLAYIERMKRRGLDISESHIVCQALVEFLDEREKPDCQKSENITQTNNTSRK